jgi:hypothetical protein
MDPIEGENGGTEQGVERWFHAGQREGELRAIKDRKGGFSSVAVGVRQIVHDEIG